MKTLVMTVIFAMTSMVNVFSGNSSKNFAYNAVENNGQVESELVFKVEDDKFLQNYLKYNFLYDAEGRAIRKEALKWNDTMNVFERYYCLNYIYTEAGADVEYALWDNNTNSYSDIREKAVYLVDGENVNYLSYKWNEKANDWNLLVEHSTADDAMNLFAGK